MELLVVVLCLLSERFYVHERSHKRFHWFIAYSNGISSLFHATLPRCSSHAIIALIVLPLLFLAGFILHLVDHLLFGIIGLLVNIALFYYCIGPTNPFYPVHAKPADHLDDEDISDYLVQVNNELFAILFWYLLAGPVGILAYRLISLSKNLTKISGKASGLLDLFDWLPVRMTALLYLLAGNFQAGYRHFSNMFFSPPRKNKKMLSDCGMLALSRDNRVQTTMLQAEGLVEHATIVFLVLLALCTIVAWVE